MERLKEEIKRIIESNQEFINNNLAYDYDTLNNYIDNLLVDDNINLDYLDMILKVDYLKVIATDLSKVIKEYINLKKLKSILEGGINNIFLTEYEQVINNCPSKIIELLNQREISKEKIEFYKKLIDENGMFDVSFIDTYIVSNASVADGLIKSVKGEIKELIKTLKNKVSELQFQDYNTSNNRQNMNNQASDIRNMVVACKNKISDLNKILNTCFVNDTMIPCKTKDELYRLLDFIKTSSLSKKDKSSIMLEVQLLNAKVLIRQNELENSELIRAIDENREEVLTDIVERQESPVEDVALENVQAQPDEQEQVQDDTNVSGTQPQDTPITFDDIINPSIVESWNLNEAEKADFIYLKEQIEAYINKKHPLSKLLNDADYKFYLDTINDGSYERAEAIVNDNIVNWEFVIYYLHNASDSKENIIELIHEIDRKSRLDEIIVEISQYINSSMELYKNNEGTDVNSLIDSLSILEGRIKNNKNEYINNDAKFRELLSEYDIVVNMYLKMLANTVKTDDSLTDLNEEHLIIFAPRVKRQLDDFPDVVYSTKIWDAIDILRKKKRFNASKDEKVKRLSTKTPGLSQTKSGTMRCLCYHVMNNIYYVPAITRHDQEHKDKFYRDTMNGYAKDGQKTAKNLREQFKNMTDAEIYNMCEESYAEIIGILASRIRENAAKQIGGGTNGDN